VVRVEDDPAGLDDRTGWLTGERPPQGFLDVGRVGIHVEGAPEARLAVAQRLLGAHVLVDILDLGD